MRIAPRIAPETLHRLKMLCAKLAHRGEHVLHVAYLGGVAAGGGYRYAAMGMLACILVAYLLPDAE